MVSELIKPTVGEWNDKVLNLHFWPVDIEPIRNIVLSLNRREDRLIWHYGASGQYTIRSGYKVAISSGHDESGSNGYGLSSWWRNRVVT